MLFVLKLFYDLPGNIRSASTQRHPNYAKRLNKIFSSNKRKSPMEMAKLCTRLDETVHLTHHTLGYEQVVFNIRRDSYVFFYIWNSKAFTS